MTRSFGTSKYDTGDAWRSLALAELGLIRTSTYTRRVPMELGESG